LAPGSHRRRGRATIAAVARCLVTRVLPGSALLRLTAAHETTVWPHRLPPTPEQLRAQLRSTRAQGLLTTVSDQIDAVTLDAAPTLTAIANYAVGTDNIDVGAATARGIAVGNTPDVLTDATADLTFALLLAAARRLQPAISTVRDGDWRTWEPSRDLGVAVHGATLGIIGGGRIGAAVARRAAGFEMEVLIHGRRGPVELPELLSRSDFVSLHCPLTPQTRHLIDADALTRMKPTAILINTARGPIVDPAALAHALHSATIAGAALDVTDPEPLPADDPLLDSPNLLIVPHIGSATHQARERMTELAVENLLAALDGAPMPHPVEPRR
jgi:glyoxylate reductase